MYISINNFKFKKLGVQKNSTCIFNKKCKAIAILIQQYRYSIVIRFIINGHTDHNEYTTNEIKKEMIRSSVKRKAHEP